MDDRESPTGIWNERSATFCEQDAREAYHELIETQLHWLFPTFLRNLQAQTPCEREKGRVAVIEYVDDEDEGAEPDIFKSSHDLQTHFEDPIATTEKTGPRKRLFILEDLGLNYVEVLGSQLRIPPSFFAAHSADPATPEFNHRNPFRRYSEHTFVIRYASTQPVRIEADPEVHGTVFKCDFNVDRHIYCYDPKGPIFDQPKCYHALSFWTSGVRHDGSWDSILLVDPPVGPYVTSLSDGRRLRVDDTSTEHAYTRMSSLDPDFSTVTILPGDASSWSRTWQRPAYMSILDDILALAPRTPAHATGPKSCTDVARKLVLCHFLAFLRRRILNMLRLQANPRTAVPHVNRCDYLRDFDQGVLSRWHHHVFGFVVNVKYNMGLVAGEAKEHFEVLGLNRTTTSSTHPHSTAAAAAGEMQLEMQVQAWERDGWLAVQEHCTKILTMADAFLHSYLQFCSMQEAQAANRNALSLARITNLTMVFVPLGTIAAIFSMSDAFMPGESKSWVFWVTAVPVLVLTFAVTVGVRGVLARWCGGLWGSMKRKGVGVGREAGAGIV